MKPITSNLSPFYQIKDSAKLSSDLVTVTIRDILNNKQIRFKDCLPLIEVWKKNKSAFTRQEIEFVVDNLPLLQSILNEQTAMKIFKEMSATEKWTQAQIAKKTSLPRKTVHAWLTELEKSKLLIIAERQDGIGNVKFYSFDWKGYGRLVYTLRHYFIEILAS